MRTVERGFRIALLAALGCGALGWASALAAAPAVPPRVTAQSTSAPSPATTVVAASEEPAEPTYTARGAQSCMKCHDQAPVTDILKSPHAVKGDSHSPFGQHDCESCHGPSDKHASSAPGYGAKRTLPEVSFVGPNVSSVEKRNAVCLNCHESAMRMDWVGSQHQNNNVACTSCHTLHAAKDPVLVKASQPEKCFTCHSEQRAQSFQSSHHPIREGKVVCSDCHNPHGSPGPRLLKETSINDTCYTCHADKRGPFLWEHESVRENCVNCHLPHGSTRARLLKERPPYLCMNCHSNGGHNASPYSASNLPTGTAQVDARAVSARMLARGCVNCHSQIHGSNSPGGSFFTR